ncbi:hypothetical protein SASPL_105532 [Salvia splendens]|uniref:ABC transporter B family member 29, chloroplastic n=1 Tax=Salvia splendens TaxID=180675 RepID=A0A8X8YJD7_SALSN|nr:hypothetical protein SASPL_105532 [Salvia splendens]
MFFSLPQQTSIAQILQFPPSYYPSSSPSLFHRNLNILGRHRKIAILNHGRIRSAIATMAAACSYRPPSIKFPSLADLSPYLQSEWRPILTGWLCSAVSVYSLSKLVPLAGQLSSSIAVSNLASLRNGALALGALLLIRIVANYLQQACLWDAALNCAYNIRVHVFDRVLQRDLGFFEGGNGILPGDVAYRITAEAEDVADTGHSLLNTIVPSVLQLSAMATQMLTISPQLSLIFCICKEVVIPAMALTVGCLGEKLRIISNEANLCTASLAAYLNEVFPSILFVKANNVESNERIRFLLFASADLSARLKKKQTKDIGKAYNELKQGEPAIERLFNLTLFKSQLIEKSDAVDLASVTGEVKVCGLYFSYRDGMAPVLNGLDLHIKAGETIALVGPSGGSILIDGCDIQNIRLQSLRRHVGLVTQDAVLFAGTIAENIGYKDLLSGVDMERVRFAAETANADGFIKCLPDQLAIARALYQNPSILILDEATSALDSRSELLVRQALQRLMQDRTVEVIAHRVETVLMAERIFLLRDGKLQQLSHSDLGSLASGLVI